MTPPSLRLPLLRDWHTHPLLYAAFRQGVDLGRDPGERREEAIARIRAGVRGPAWTIAYGWNNGRYALAKEDFDDLPPLVILNLSLHGLIVNEAGRALLRRSDAAIAGHLDEQDWIERNLRRVLNLFADEGASADRLRRFFGWLLQEHGVYHAAEMLLVGQHEIRLFEEAGLAGRTTFWAAPDLYDVLPPAARGKVHGIKLFADGALSARTAALHRPYRGSSSAGMLIYEARELERLLARTLDAGKPVAVHAIGDRAIDQVVAAVEAVTGIGARAAGAVRIEHAQLISETTARRAKTLGIHLCMQPNFSDDSMYYADRLPDGYAERNNPFRMLIDRIGFVPGTDLLLGSDGMPHGVREGLRQSLFPPHPDQALTADEFAAGYCLPAGGAGHIDVWIDHDRRQVTHRVVLEQSGATLAEPGTAAPSTR